MEPIRVALIGLSGAPADQYEGVNWAASAHLPFLIKNAHYQLIGLLNSTPESARNAITKHNLPASIKTYASPEELAADHDVDMVVCSTRVDRHFAPIRPSIIAGKIVFVEWPLERNLEIIREMTALAKQHNGKTIVGMQGSFSTAARKMKQILDSGKLGTVLSSTAFAADAYADTTVNKNVRYFLDREVGGHAVSIHLGHLLEVFISVLGEFKSWDSLFSIGLPHKDVVDSEGKVFQVAAPNNVPDQHMLQGLTAAGFPFSLHHRGGSPFPSTPGLEWRIQGSAGELRLTSPSSFLNIGHPNTKIELFDAKTGEVTEVEVEKDELDGYPLVARTIGREYEAWRKGEWVPDFEWALKSHEMLEEMWRRYDASVKS